MQMAVSALCCKHGLQHLLEDAQWPMQQPVLPAACQGELAAAHNAMLAEAGLSERTTWRLLRGIQHDVALRHWRTTE